MPKFKLTWWESNRWESIVTADSEDEAIEKAKEMTDEVFDNAKETENSWIESGDYIATEIIEEEPEEDSAGFTIQDRREEEKEEE